MSTITKQTFVPLWHYSCPECGISDQETRYHGQTHMIYCEVCLEGKAKPAGKAGAAEKPATKKPSTAAKPARRKSA